MCVMKLCSIPIAFTSMQQIWTSLAAWKVHSTRVLATNLNLRFPQRCERALRWRTTEIPRHHDVSIGAARQMVAIFALTFSVLAPVIANSAADVQRKHLLLAGLGVFVIANLGTVVAST